MTGLFPSLTVVGAVLVLAGLGGYAAAGALFSEGGRRRPERAAWGFALGLLWLAGFVPVSFAVGARPNWIGFLLLGGLGAALLRLLPRIRVERKLAPPEAPENGGPTVAVAALWLLLCLGLLLYLLRALTEPMWATDFLAIWGWKAKTIFATASVPTWTWRMPELAYTHPEYPLGLPFLYAGISFLIGRWDDHAMALLFPLLQAATLLWLGAWLRRRGASQLVAIGAAAALSLFEPLYRAFTTGMAEVPLSFFLLLLGTALLDALEGEPRASVRLALAALSAAALKNEGLFAAGAVALLAAACRAVPVRVRVRVALSALLPALGIALLHRASRGALPLRDFRLGLLFEPEFPARLLIGLRTIGSEVLLPAAPGLLALAVLLAAGRHSPAGDRLLALAAILLAAYAVLPAICVWGPDWLVRTAFARTAAALAPLVAAGTALRLAVLFDPFTSSGGSTESEAGPAAFPGRLAGTRRGNRAS